MRMRRRWEGIVLYVGIVLAISLASIIISLQLGEQHSGAQHQDAAMADMPTDYGNASLLDNAQFTPRNNGQEEQDLIPHGIMAADLFHPPRHFMIPTSDPTFPPFRAHQTSRIFNNFSHNLARGVNLMTSISGCHIAAWVYYQSNKDVTLDCSGPRSSTDLYWYHRKDDSSPIPHELEPYDTVYIHKRMVQAFVENTLPHLKTPIVLLTGGYENSRDFRLPKHVIQNLLQSPVILHWFCTNLYETTGFQTLPPKLHPLALGVEPFGKDPKRHPHPMGLIRDTILRHVSLQGPWEDLPEKTIGILEAYTSPFTNPNRANMPRGIRLPLPEYLEQLIKSKFVLSPNGHKPDCFRHYEALGLGAIPITELDPILYSHLQSGPVIYQNKHWWNLTEADALQRLGVTQFPTVNRNLIFEEYWMEDMEKIVGHPLRWYDVKAHQRSLLKDFQLDFDEIPTMIELAWSDYSPNSSLMLQNYIGERSFRHKKSKLAMAMTTMRQQQQQQQHHEDSLRNSSVLDSSSSSSVVVSPRRFNNMTTNLARGANLMTSISGCHMAAWIYMNGKKYQNKDCAAHRSNPQQRFNFQTNPLPAIEAYDTIYVHVRMVKDFVNNLLPRLNVPIILLSGSYDNTRNSRVPTFAVEAILQSTIVEHWFCQNVFNSTGLPTLPSKIHPLALGIEPFGKDPLAHPNPVVIIRDALLRHAKELPNKTVGVFEAYTSPYTNPSRRHMPRGIRLALPDYLEQLALSKFVLSPNGHKPDCFRHYEALAFGAIPITELDPHFYSHLAAGPVVYKNTEWWNLTEAQVLTKLNMTMFPKDVNRNLIFEEYWMEDIERVVGRRLRWFDIRRQKRSLLEDFYINYDDITLMIKSAWADYSNDSNVIMTNFVGEKQSWKRKQWPPRLAP